MRQNNRLSLDNRSTGGWTSASVLQILVISTGTDPSGGGTSLEVTSMSGTGDQVTDFSVVALALLTDLLLACMQRVSAEMLLLTPCGAEGKDCLRQASKSMFRATKRFLERPAFAMRTE